MYTAKAVLGYGSISKMIRVVMLVTYFISLYIALFWLSVLIDRKEHKEKRLKNFPSVSICIPAYNEEEDIAETVNSVLRIDYPMNRIDVIVVNDGSTDRTMEIVEGIKKKNKGRRIILLNQENKGKAAAMNYALKVAKGEYFVSLDADCIASRDALKKLLPYFSKDVGAVLPIIKVRNKDTFMRKIQWCEYLVNFFYKRLIGELDCIHVTPGPFSVYKIAVLREVGGYDVGNLTEDLEIALKIQRRHYKIVQLLNTTIYTKAPPTVAAFCKQRNRWYKGGIINIVRYRDMLLNRKYGDLGTFFLPTVLVSAVASLVLFMTFIIFVVIKPLVLKIRDVLAINFDLKPMFSNFLKNFAAVDINYAPMFLGFVILIVSVVFIVLAYKYARESFKKNLYPIILYMFMYPMIMAFIWSGVFIGLLFNRKQKW